MQSFIEFLCPSLVNIVDYLDDVLCCLSEGGL